MAFWNRKTKRTPASGMEQSGKDFGTDGSVVQESAEEQVRHLREIGVDVTEEQVRFMRYQKAADEPDLQQRICLLEQVAEEGEAAAWYDLGVIYVDHRNENGMKNWAKARACLKKAADRNLPRAMSLYGNLSLHYAMDGKEEVTEEDRDIIHEGLHYLAMATKYAEDSAFRVLLDLTDADWFREAMRNDLRQCTEELMQRPEKTVSDLTALGLYYLNGLYLEQDLEKARQYFQQAKDMGGVDALIYLNNPIFEDNWE